MDTSQEQLPASELVSLSVELASAYVSNNSVPAAELPKLLSEIHDVLRGMNGVPAQPAPEEVKLTPAVSVKKSVTPDFIICLEDGKSFKSLKRHLQTKYGLSPQQYRAKWNLPADYPMVAPSYAAARSALARASGLGQMRATQANSAPAAKAAPQAAPEPAAVEAPAKQRGGRRPKAASANPVVVSKPETKSTARSAGKNSKPATGAKAKRTPRKATAN